MDVAHTIGLRRYTPGAKDAHGNAVAAWAAPVDWHVYGIAPSVSEEPFADRLAVSTGLSVLAPPDPLPGPLDLVVVDGEEWKVEGEVANYTRGPFEFEGGVVVNLKRTEG